MLCELAGLLGGALGLAIGATLVGLTVGMALRGTRVRQLRVAAAVAILGVGLYLLALQMRYPRAFRNVLLQNVEFWAGASLLLGAIVWGIGLLLELRRQGGSDAG